MLLLAAAVASNAQPTPIVLEATTAGGVTLEPQVEWERARLTVGGVGGYRIERTYTDEEPITLGGLAPSGSPLRDGIYRYELSLFSENERTGLGGGYLSVESGEVTLRGPRGEEIAAESAAASPGGAPVTPGDLVDEGDIKAGGGLSSGDTSLNPFDGQVVLEFGGASSTMSRYIGGTGIHEGIPLPVSPPLWVGDDGRVGLSTSVPAAQFHVQSASGGEVALIDGGALAVRRLDGLSPSIIFEDLNQDYRFLLSAGNGAFNIFHASTGVAPLKVFPGGVSNALVLRGGKIGIKKADPAHPIHVAGGARLTAGGVWTDASSREIKTDIEALSTEEAFAALEELDPVKFAYKVDETDRHVGFIAEDVPDLVATPDRKALAAMDVVAVLTKVVQEQQAQIAEQKRQFESELAELRELLVSQQDGADSRQ
jgi:hypothetical protein